MKIAKIFATGISGDIRSEFTVYNVKDVKTIKLTDQCKCYQFLGCEKGKAQAIYLHKTSDVFFRLIPDIEDIITIIEQEYSELSKAYQEKEKIYSSKAWALGRGGVRAMRNKKTIKEFRAFYIMASSVYAKSSRKRKSGVIVQFNKKHGRPSSEHPWEVIIPRITVIPGWISW